MKNLADFIYEHIGKISIALWILAALVIFTGCSTSGPAPCDRDGASEYVEEFDKEWMRNLDLIQGSFMTLPQDAVVEMKEATHEFEDWDYPACAAEVHETGLDFYRTAIGMIDAYSSGDMETVNTLNEEIPAKRQEYLDAFERLEND